MLNIGNNLNMKTKTLNTRKARQFLYCLLAVILITSCNRQKLTKKDIMNAYTVGWHQGYEQGMWKHPTKKEELFWKKSRWSQDSCLMENSLWAIK